MSEALQPLTPLDMLRVATEKGFDADQLEKLVRLNEQWEAGEARKAFAGAMVAAQAEMPAVLTDAANPQTRSRYARLETVTALVKPVYSRHGFSLSFGTADSPLNPPPGAEGGRWVRVTCDVRHARGHAERYQVDMPLDGIGPKGNPIGAMNAPQAVGSTTAYGRRYLTAMIFNLVVADEDNDAVGTLSRVSLEQAEEVRRLLAEAGKEEKGFLAWAKVDQIEELSSKQFETAKRMLKKKGAPNGQG